MVCVCICVCPSECVYLHVCTCMYVHTYMCTCMCGGVHTAYMCLYTYNVVLVIVYEVPLRVSLEECILVLPTKVTSHNLYQCNTLH